MSDRTKFLLIVGVFLVAYFLPLHHPRVQTAIWDMFLMMQDYARKHVLFCLVPAFFIAGAISVFISQAAVLRYFGPRANRVVAYGLASISGTILAVCSCTVLPLFAGLYRRGAGIGPATAFLYSGPAINVLAIVLTARVLGFEIGLARVVGAVLFSFIVGLLMHALFRREEEGRLQAAANDLVGEAEAEARPLWQTASFVGVLVLILIFASWSKPATEEGLWAQIYRIHWFITLPLLGILGLMLWRWFDREQRQEWVAATWTFAALILPLLFMGVLATGFLLGMPGTDHGIIPSRWVAAAVGGNSLRANLLASVVGALMYFATLTEVPILQGLLGSGMGKGPALALLLAGPALSLPNMLVIRSIIGTKKMLAFVTIIVVLATISGLLFGAISS